MRWKRIWTKLWWKKPVVRIRIRWFFLPCGSGAFLTGSGSYPQLLIKWKNSRYSLKMSKYFGNIKIISLLSCINKSIKKILWIFSLLFSGLFWEGLRIRWKKLDPHHSALEETAAVPPCCPPSRSSSNLSSVLSPVLTILTHIWHIILVFIQGSVYFRDGKNLFFLFLTQPNRVVWVFFFIFLIYFRFDFFLNFFLLFFINLGVVFSSFFLYIIKFFNFEFFGSGYFCQPWHS